MLESCLFVCIEFVHTCLHLDVCLNDNSGKVVASVMDVSFEMTIARMPFDGLVIEALL